MSKEHYVNTSRLKIGSHEGKRQITQPDSVSAADYIAVLDRLEGESRERIRRHHQNALKVEKILADLDTELKEKIGESIYKKYRDYRKDRVRSNHGLNLSNYDKNSVKRLDLAKKETRDKSLSILRESSVTTDDLHGIYKKYGESLKNLYRRVDNHPELELCEVLDTNKVPKRVLEATESNTPITKKPPYDGWWDSGMHFSRIGGEDPQVTYYVNTNGRVGHYLRCVNDDAGDNDYFYVWADSEVGFWKNIPKTGNWDVWINLGLRKSYSHYWVYNEAGNSYMNAWSSSDLYFGAYPDPQSIYFTGGWNLHYSYVYGDGVDGNYNYNAANPNWLHFKLSNVPAHNSVYIFVGLSNSIAASLNDYSAHVLLDDRWVIKQVSIEIV